jgi:superfamily II DNA or RNA helicase/ribosome modulation factor
MSRSDIVKERPIQTKAFDSVTKLLETRGECLVKMFCGTGKSHVMKRLIMEQKKSLSIIVFPSLALIRQFTNDYLCDTESRVYGIMNVSSEELKHITSTTDPMQIHHFLNNPNTKHQKKIICVTYQSLDVLLSSIGDTNIGIACFDEAHRTTSPEAKELVYGDEYRTKYEKRVFFTATPVNANGITMFDRERDEMGTYGDCGPLACEYTYLQGLRDAILSLFELRIDLYTQDTVANMYESIARAILTTGNTRVLTFHADAAAESDSETSVLRFVDKAKFVEAFRAVCAKEFPDKAGKFADDRITFTAITAETKNKDAILGAFETCSDDEIYIVASCRTIGEGVDTKKANMCVFVDPKSSVISIIQNIGRICRKIAGSERQPATILIPVCIGWDKYREAGDDPEVQDKLIREQLNDRENGDYNAIMNIVAALKQEDPELYELCLRYPSKFTEAEIKHALEEQNKKYDPENHTNREEIDELVENGGRVEIYTSNVEQPIVYRGFDEDDEYDERPIHRFYEDLEHEDGEIETRYHPIVSMNGEEEDEEESRKRLNPPKATNRPRMNIHTNDEIKLLWRMGDVALGEQFGSGVLECEVERIDPMDVAKKIVGWCKKNERLPKRKNIRKKNKDDFTQDEILEGRYSATIGRWKQALKGNGHFKCPENVKMHLDENLPGWNDEVDFDIHNMNIAKNIVEWSRENDNKLPMFITKRGKVDERTEEEKKETSFAQKLKRFTDAKNGKEQRPIADELIDYLNKHLPGWSETGEDKMTKDATEIIEWYKKNRRLPRFMHKPKGEDTRTIDEQNEFDYASKLGRWKRCLSSNACDYYPKIKKMMDENIPNWNASLGDLALQKAEEIVVWFKENKRIPVEIRKRTNPDDRTEDELKENHYSSKLCNFRQGLKGRGTTKCPKNVRDYLDEHLPGWRTEIDLEKKGIADIEELVKRAKIRESMGKNLMPIDRKPINKQQRTPEEIQETKDAQKLNNCKSGLEGRSKSTCTPEMKQYLDLHLPGWNENIDREKIQFEKARQIVKWIKDKKKYPERSGDTEEEKEFYSTLMRWKSESRTKCCDNVKEYLDKEIPGWSNKKDDLQMMKAIEIVNWCNENKRQPKKNSGNEIEQSFYNKLSAWRKGVNGGYGAACSNDIKTYLDVNLPGWRPVGDVSIPPPPPPTPLTKPKPRLVIKKSHLIPNPSSLECSAPETNPSNPKRVIANSPYKLTGRAWATQKSSTTHEKLQSNPAEWHAYHAARDISFQGYADQSQIPRNRVIAHLANKRKHRLRILDLGCGRNNIAQHYAHADKDHKFAIQGYDHIAEEGSGALVGNIADLAAQEEDESADICIYSQSLMGSDWRDYLTEGHRMLRYNGEFIISEHIKMLDDVRAELGRLGCKVESVNADAGEAAEAEDADDKVAKWFVLVARKV